MVGADHRPVGVDLDHRDLVDLHELGRLGERGAGHPGELVVEAEVVLQRDRREGLVLLADPHPLLRLDRLVQAVRPAPALEDAAGELVDDLHLAVDHRVVGVALEQRLGLQRLDQVVDERAVLGDVEVVDAEELLRLRDSAPRSERRSCASRRTRSRARPRRCRVTRRATSASASSPRRPSAWRGGRRCSRCRRPARAAGDDQRRPRLVDQDVVDLVDDPEDVLALDALLERARPCCRAGSRTRTRSWSRR